MNIWENRYDVKSGFIENSGFKAPASWDNDNPVSSFRPKWRNLFRLRLNRKPAYELKRETCYHYI